MNKPEKKSFLGLSIHPEYFSMVEMGKERLYALGTKELLQPFQFDLFRNNGEALNTYSRILRDLIRQSGCRSKDLSVVLNMGMVHIKKIPMALGLDPQMIAEHLNWEAEQFLIDPVDDYVLEHQRLPIQMPSGNPVYLMVLVRRYIVSKVQQMVKKAGLNLVDLDVDVFSNIRMLLNNYSLDPQETAVLIDMQHHLISISIVRNREFFLSHSIEMMEGGAPGEMSLEMVAEKIQKDLKRLVFGHRLGQTVDDLGRFFLTGGPQIREMASELGKRISAPLEVVNPFQKCRVARSLSQSSALNEFPERFSSSVGGVLKLIES